MNRGPNKKAQNKRANRKKRGPVGGIYLRIIKCALAGCVLTVILVLVLALLLKWNAIPESALFAITSAIKAICAATVGFLCADGAEKRGWLAGGIGGCAYIVIAFISFSAVEQMFIINYGLLADIIMGIVAGAAGSALLRVKAA